MKQLKDANLDCCITIFKIRVRPTFLRVFSLPVVIFTNFDSFTTFKSTISTIKLETMFVFIVQSVFLIYIHIIFLYNQLIFIIFCLMKIILFSYLLLASLQLIQNRSFDENSYYVSYFL